MMISPVVSRDQLFKGGQPNQQVRVVLHAVPDPSLRGESSIFSASFSSAESSGCSVVDTNGVASGTLSSPPPVTVLT